MNFAPNMTQVYLNSIKSRIHDEQILLIARELIGQIPPDFKFQKTAVKFRTPTKDDWPQLQKIITLAYQGRYANRHELHTFSLGEIDTSSHIRTIIATHPLPAHKKNQTAEIILGTLRLVQGQLELFDFFDIEGGWQAQYQDQTPYEFERLAFHPLFDVSRDNDWRVFILRGLIYEALNVLDLETVWLACTMNPHVKKFMDHIGIETQEIIAATMSDNDIIRYQKHHWPDYFAVARPYVINKESLHVKTK